MVTMAAVSPMPCVALMAAVTLMASVAAVLVRDRGAGTITAVVVCVAFVPGMCRVVKPHTVLLMILLIAHTLNIYPLGVPFNGDSPHRYRIPCIVAHL